MARASTLIILLVFNLHTETVSSSGYPWYSSAQDANNISDTIVVGLDKSTADLDVEYVRRQTYVSGSRIKLTLAPFTWTRRHFRFSSNSNSNY